MATVLLLNANGADGSTSIVDEVGHAITVNGGAQLSTAQSKFGGSSLRFDGIGDYLSMAGTSDFDIFSSGVTGTVECWFYMLGDSSLPAAGQTRSACLFQANCPSSGTIASFFGLFIGATDTTTGVDVWVDLTTSGGTYLRNIYSKLFSKNQWYHLAVVRTSTGSVDCYVDGVQLTRTQDQIGTTSVTIGTANTAKVGALMYTSSNTYGREFYGHIDNLRISKGGAIYTSNFTPATQQFFYNNTILYMPMDGTNGSTSIVDATGRLVTVTGNASLSTAQSVFGGSSLFVDGTSDSVSVPTSTDFNLGTYEFTIEMWIRPTSVTGNKHILARYAGQSAGTFAVYQSGSQIGFYASSNGSTWDVVSNLSWGTFAVNTWYHIAATRQGSTFRVFRDGTLIGTSSSGGALQTNSGAVYIGSKDATTETFAGYIDDLRISRSCKYTTDFTLPTAAHLYEYTKLLIHAEGPNNGTTIVSENGQPVTVAGNARISTAQYKIGSSSIYFDGTGDYVDVPASSDFASLSADFTVEAWVFTDPAVAIWARLMENVAYDSSTKGWHFSYNGNDSAGNRRLGIQLSNPGGGGTRIDTNAALPTNQWVHVAFVRYNNTGYLYVDGLQQTATLNLSAYSFDATSLRIGATLGAASNYFTGYVDEIRISKGIAHYTTNFTPPLSTFTLLGQYVYTITGTVRSDTGTLTARTVRLYRRDNGSFISETTSNGTTGAFTFSNVSPIEYYLVCLDDAGGTQYNSLIQDRIIPT